MSMTAYPYVKAALTADGTAQGVVTVADSTKFPKGAICFLNGTGKATLRVKVVEQISGTTLSVRAAPEVIPGASEDLTPALGYGGPNYGRTDVSTYTVAASSALTMPAQGIFGDGSSDPIPLPNSGF